MEPDQVVTKTFPFLLLSFLNLPLPMLWVQDTQVGSEYGVHLVK